MPCCDMSPYYDQPTTTHAAKNSKQVDSLRKELASLGKKYNELKKRADNLTQLLCYACGTLIPVHGEQDLDSCLTDWWHAHDEWDFKRTLDALKKKFGNGSATKEKIRMWFIRQAEDVHPLSNYHRGEYFDRVYDAFIDWQKNTKNRAKRIAELEAELAKLRNEA